MKNRLLPLLCLLAALALECFPGAAVMRFAAGPDSPVFEPIPYFSMLALGYAYFAPVAAGACTLAGAIAAYAAWRRPQALKAGRVSLVLSVLAALLSVVTVLTPGRLTLHALSVPLLLCVSSVWQALSLRRHV